MAATPLTPPSKIGNLDDFVKVHSILLAASGIPSSLYPKLFEKLSSETFDGGNYFSIEVSEEEEVRQRRLVLSADKLEKESDLFLVDHAWTFRLQDALKQLKEVPGLVQRMAALMCVDIDLESDAIEGEIGMNGKYEDNIEHVLEKIQLNVNELNEKGAVRQCAKELRRAAY